MVTIARRFTRLASCFVLVLFAVNQAWALAGPRLIQDAATSPHTEPGAWIPADFAAGSGFGLAYHTPRWLDTGATAPTQTGSWWSRRTAAQKTWFIVGLVAGAYGVYALVSQDSDGNNGGGGGGGY